MILLTAVLPFFGILIGLVILHELGHFVVPGLRAGARSRAPLGDGVDDRGRG